MMVFDFLRERTLKCKDSIDWIVWLILIECVSIRIACIQNLIFHSFVCNHFELKKSKCHICMGLRLISVGFCVIFQNDIFLCQHTLAPQIGQFVYNFSFLAQNMKFQNWMCNNSHQTQSNPAMFMIYEEWER